MATKPNPFAKAPKGPCKTCGKEPCKCAPGKNKFVPFTKKK